MLVKTISDALNNLKEDVWAGAETNAMRICSTEGARCAHTFLCLLFPFTDISNIHIVISISIILCIAHRQTLLCNNKKINIDVWTSDCQIVCTVRLQ